MSNPPSIAKPVAEEEWNFAKHIQTSEHYFVLLSRKATLPQTVPAEKFHPVEFFLKP